MMSNKDVHAGRSDHNAMGSSPTRPLQVSWFDRWQPVLDEALQALPEAESCPHELYRLLVQNQDAAHKRTALVTDRGEPVAVVGLRQIGRCHWEPVTQWLLPGIVCPARPGYLMPALEALKVDLRVAWWRLAGPPPPSPLMRYSECTPVYRMPCTADFERYWRKTRYFKTIQHSRHRCEGFTWSVNAPGAATWVIQNWDSKWHEHGATADLSLADRLLAATYLERRGQHYTHVLLDGETPIAGATSLVHGRDLVAGVIYRHPDYDRFGVGVRIIDLVFAFAAENGFERMDIGGGYDYKQKWAPQEGERWQFDLCPSFLYRAKQLVHWEREAWHKVTDWLHHRSPSLN